MTTETVILRHTISRVSETFPADYALTLLEDPHYSKILEIVDSEKPEVLGQPQIDGKPIDDDGNTIERGRDQADGALDAKGFEQTSGDDAPVFDDLANSKED